MKTSKVALITTIIAPYRIPVFNHLAQHPAIDLTVLFEREMTPWRNWKVYREDIRFDYEILPAFSLPLKQKMSGIILSRGILLVLKRGKFDIIICGGWNSLAAIQALAFSKLTTTTSCFLWSESSIFNKPRHLLLEATKRQIVKCFDGWIAAGRTSRDYLLCLGACSERIYIAPDAVDTDFFHRKSRETVVSREEIKRQRGYPRHLILYVGRLIDKKGISFLLEAFQRLDRKDVGLVLVGEGPQKREYQEYCAMHHVPQVYFEGFQPLERLPQYYAIADVFVFPTLTDTWGLVMNEAMSCRLPVISSSQAGASADLILEGMNGYTYEPTDVDRLVHLMKKLLDNEPLRHKMGENSWRIIQYYTPEKCAQGFAEAILCEPNGAGRWAGMTQEERMRLLR